MSPKDESPYLWVEQKLSKAHRKLAEDIFMQGELTSDWSKLLQGDELAKALSAGTKKINGGSIPYADKSSKLEKSRETNPLYGEW